MKKEDKKATYKKPKVTCYGKVSEITAAGAGSMMEGVMATAMKRFP